MERHKTLDDWEIKSIYQSAYDNGNRDYVLSHWKHLPQGKVFMNTTKRKVLEEIKNNLKP